jgi:hypothetical protein
MENAEMGVPLFSCCQRVIRLNPRLILNDLEAILCEPAWRRVRLTLVCDVAYTTIDLLVA